MTSLNLQEQFRAHRDEQPQLLAEGDYTLECVRCTANKDGDKLFPAWKVVGGPYAGKTAQCGTWTLNSNERARDIFFKHVKGMGLTNEFLETARSLEDIATALVGRIIQCHVKVKEWQGTDRNEIQIGSVRLAEGGAPPAPAVAPPVDTAESVQANATPPPATAAPPPPPPPPAGAPNPF